MKSQSCVTYTPRDMALSVCDIWQLLPWCTDSAHYGVHVKVVHIDTTINCQTFHFVSAPRFSEPSDFSTWGQASCHFCHFVSISRPTPGRIPLEPCENGLMGALYSLCYTNTLNNSSSHTNRVGFLFSWIDTTMMITWLLWGLFHHPELSENRLTNLLHIFAHIRECLFNQWINDCFSLFMHEET